MRLCSQLCSMPRRGIELYETDVEMCPPRGIEPHNFIAIKDARRKDARPHEALAPVRKS